MLHIERIFCKGSDQFSHWRTNFYHFISHSILKIYVLLHYNMDTNELIFGAIDVNCYVHVFDMEKL